MVLIGGGVIGLELVCHFLWNFVNFHLVLAIKQKKIKN